MCELIGGAKPYGYGKVKVTITDLKLENQGNDFTTLILKPQRNVERKELQSYIKTWLEKRSEEYFRKMYMTHYLESKLELRPDEEHIHWMNLKEKAGRVGYPENWRLKPIK
jgi:hypothetical protein